MKSAARYSALVGALALGLLAALLVFKPGKAHAYTMNELANMGFGIVFISLPQNGCHAWKIGWHNEPKTYLGSDCDPGFNDKLTAFLAANCPPAVCGVPTVTVTNETTDVETTTETDVETTTETATLPAETVTNTQTETDTMLVPSPPPDAVTVRQPVTVTETGEAVTTTVQRPAPHRSAPAPVTTVMVEPAPPPKPPQASFRASTFGLLASLADTSGDGAVTWSFGDGSNGVGASVEHLFPHAGSYVVVETVVDAHGLVAQEGQTVTVAVPTGTRARRIASR